MIIEQLVAAGTPPPDDTVGPGVGGFLAIFALALATVVLMRSMVGHLRKVRYGPGPDDDPSTGPTAGRATGSAVDTTDPTTDSNPQPPVGGDAATPPARNGGTPPPAG